MSSYYYVPAFDVKIDGSRLEVKDFKYISQITVTKELDRFDQCSLTLANPDLRWTIKDVERFKIGSSMLVKLYHEDNAEKGKVKNLFDGEIIAIAPTFPENGIPTVRIQGYNRLHWLNGSTVSDNSKDKTDKELVKEIAQNAGLTLSWEGNGSISEHDGMSRYNRTDLQFILERAGQTGFEVLVDGKKLLFRKPEKDPGKAIVLEWGKNLKSFSPKLNTANQVGEVIVKSSDHKNKNGIEGRAASGFDEDTMMGGNKSGAYFTKEAFGRLKTRTLVNQPVENQKQADDLACAIYNEELKKFLTGSGSCIGNPDLVAGCRIDIKELGDHFSGQYDVTRATHSIGSAGYLTTFDVRRNSVNEK